MLENSRFCRGFTIVLLISLICVTNADQRQKVLDFHAECLDTHGVEEETLIQFLEGTAIEDEDFFHHIFCAARKAKVMSEDGIVNVDNFEIDMKEVIDPHNMPNIAGIIRKCLQQKEDVMTTIREASNCFRQQNHRL